MSEQNLYRITVENQGNQVGEHLIKAIDALTAINLVESSYGEPAQVEWVSVELEHGRKRQALLVHHWHGYTFHAQRCNGSGNGIN